MYPHSAVPHCYHMVEGQVPTYNSKIMPFTINVKITVFWDVASFSLVEID
jgi:hypothetical protein